MLTVASCHSTQHCIFRITNEIIFLVFLENDIVLFIKVVKRIITIIQILSANYASAESTIRFTATMKMWTHNSLSCWTFASWSVFSANRASAVRTIWILRTKRIRIHYSSVRSGQVHIFVILPHFWQIFGVQKSSRHPGFGILLLQCFKT